MESSAFFPNIGKNKKTEEIKHQMPVEKETFPLEREFSTFLKSVNELPVDYESDTKDEELIEINKLIPLYRKAFGDAGVESRTLVYRAGHISPGDFLADFIVLDDNPSGKKEYLINRKNIDLLKYLALPLIDKELREIAASVGTYHDEFNTLDELEDLGPHISKHSRDMRISEDRTDFKN